MDGCQLDACIKAHLRPWVAGPVDSEESMKLKVMVRSYDQACHDMIVRLVNKAFSMHPFNPACLCENVTLLQRMVASAPREEVASIKFTPVDLSVADEMKTHGYTFRATQEIDRDSRIVCNAATYLVPGGNGAWVVRGATERFADAFDVVTFSTKRLCPRYAMLILEMVFKKFWKALYPNNPALIIERHGYPDAHDVVYTVLPSWSLATNNP